MTLSWSKKMVSAMLLAMLVIGMLPYSLQGGTAYAAGPEIKIETELGYQGNLKHDKWNPLKLVLTSNEDLAGDIVVQISDSSGWGEVSSYVQYVDLPKDTPKEVIMAIPGINLNKDNNSITFYEGSYKDGDPVKLPAGKEYITKATMQGALIGVLSDDPDTMNFLAVLNGAGSNLRTVPMEAEDVASDSMLLSGLDVIVVNNFASDTLSQPQQEAVKDWVKSGGTLVLAGGAGYAKTAAPFADIAPVQAGGTLEVNELPELQRLGGKELKLDGAFTISSGTLAEGAAADSTASNVPLFASKKLEQGTVIYAAYDLAMEPVSSWAGHADVWATVLRSELPMNSQVYYGSPLDQLSYILDYFPSLKMPSFPVLLWMLAAYALVAAPLLYFILKKFDKREWAWFLIPMIAIVASGAIYMVGSADKTREIAHTINMLELDGQGKAAKTTASALFTPRSGDYQLEFPENTYLKTQRSNISFSGGLSESNSYIRMEENETILDLRDMPQWSLAKLFAENDKAEEVGSLKVDVEIDGKGQLIGKVTNETMSDLTDVVLFAAGRAYKMGDIPRQSSASIPSDKKAIVQVNGGDIAYALYPHNSNQDSYERQREILSYYSNRSGTAGGTFIFGWSEDELTQYTLKGQPIDSDQLNLWVQQVEVQWGKDGIIDIPYGFVIPEIVQSNAPNFAVYPHGVDIGQGSMIAEFPLTSAGDVDYTEFTIKGTKLDEGMTMEIWNAEAGEWEPLPEQSNVFTVTEEPERYIIDNRIRFNVSSSNQRMFQMPQISLKGEVK